MKSLALKVGILVLAFAIGVFVNTQVNRLAYYLIPDVDPQPRSNFSITCYPIESAQKQ